MRQRSRLIEIDVAPATVADPRQHYRREQQKDRLVEHWIDDGIYHCLTTWHCSEYKGGVGMVTTQGRVETKQPAVITYSQIQEAVTVEEDCGDMNLPPWEESDGWEHAQKLPQHDGEYDSHRFVRCDNDFLIVIDHNSYGGWSRESRYESFRCKGASKQVAAELVAQQDREYVRQLKDWYQNGIDYWAICVNLPAPFNYLNESLGRIDDYDYAVSEAADTIYNICERVRACGWEISDGPTVADIQKIDQTKRRQVKLDRLLGNLNMFNWTYNGARVRNRKS